MFIIDKASQNENLFRIEIGKGSSIITLNSNPSSSGDLLSAAY